MFGSLRNGGAGVNHIRSITGAHVSSIIEYFLE